MMKLWEERIWMVLYLLAFTAIATGAIWMAYEQRQANHTIDNHVFRPEAFQHPVGESL